MKSLYKFGQILVCFLLSLAVVLTTASASDISSYYGTPYSTDAFVISKAGSVLRFCDYDNGPEGIAFKEMDANNTNVYRSGAVDLYQFGTTLVTLSGLSEGEWVNYTVKVNETGYYDFDLGSCLNVSSLPDCIIHFELDGKNITGPITLSRTDSKVDIPRQIIKNILLKQGDHIFTMVVEQGTGHLADLGFTWSENQVDLSLKKFGLDKSALTLAKGDVELLKLDVEPMDADVSDVIWECDNESVARINENGVVEALSCGIASVKAHLGGMTAMCKINVVAATLKKPYKEYKLSEEAFIPCVDYNIGGNNVAFYKQETKKSSLYRNDGLVIEGESETYYIYDTHPGEWIKYTFTAEKTDLFNVGVLCNTEENSGRFSLFLDNKLIIDSASVNQGAVWNDFIPVEAREVLIDEGTHTLKLIFEEAGGMYNGIEIKRARTLDDLTFDNTYKGTPYDNKAFSIGIENAVLPIWRFDEGGNGVAYHSALGKKSEGSINYKVRLYEDVNLYNYDDGIVALRDNNAGEWLNYTIDVNKNGYYDVKITTSWKKDEGGHEGSVHLELDGVPITEEKDMPDTGSWNDWTQVSLGNIYLPKGKHLLKLVLDTSGSGYTELCFTYTGDDIVTRGEFVHALSRDLISFASFEENFSDVPYDASYYEAVGTLKALSIIKGGNDGLFRPDDPITKEQAVHILTELLKATGRLKVNTDTKVLDTYQDAAYVSSWAKPSMAAMANAGLALGAQNKISAAEPMKVSTVENFIDFAGKCVAVSKEIPQIEPEYLAEELAPSYDWIEKELVRGMYGHPIDLDRPELVTNNIKKWGLNTMFIHVMYRENETPEGFRALAKRVKEFQDKLDIKLMFSIPYGSCETYGNTQFGAMATGSEFIKWRTPCPLSQGYWDAVVGDRAVIAAEEGVTGLIVDMEMYGADSTMHGGPCYCDSCWSRFIYEYTDIKEPLLIPETERAAAVAQSGIAVDYTRWQEIAVAELLSGIEKRVHATDPDFILGNMLYFESLPGLARGLGTPERPALTLSEAEYSGAISAVPSRVYNIKTQGYPALFISGFWPNPIKAPDLYDKITQGAPLGSGYWLYWAQSFKQEDPDHHPDYTTDEYIETLIKANTGLNEILESGEYIDVSNEITAPTYTALKIDGSPTEADWAKAPYTVDFRLYTTGEVEPTSRSKILWNGRKLFVRVYNDEPQMSQLPEFEAERDRPSLWMEDCNEIFWKFSEDDSFVHYIAGRQECYWDSYGKGAGVENTAMNYDANVDVQNKSDSWVLDFSFDLTIDGERYAKSGETIGLEICRHRSLDSVDSCWAPTFGGYKHAMNLWGQVTLE